MTNKQPKLSVIIITYNQEKEIGRALESLICQKDYIYEIIVNDDCSTDNNWRIINEYAEKYPDLIKPRQNERNCGIFENYEITWRLPQGDMVYQLEGDDTCEPGYFKRIFDFIEKNKIDVYNELFCIYGDYRVVYPNGDTIIRKNDLIKRNIDPVKLSMRVLISNRSAVFCKKIMDRYVDCSKGRLHIAEKAQDVQLQIFSEKNYYLPAIGNNYYSDLGVSTERNYERFEDRQKIMSYAREMVEKQGVALDKKDLAYIDYFNQFFKARYYSNIKEYALLIYYFFRCFDSKIGFRCLDLKHILFAIVRRLPHKKPIHF